MKEKINCGNNCGKMELVETRHICPKCFNECHSFNWAGCMECHKLTIQRDTGYAHFCKEHAPTLTLGCSPEEYEKKFGISISQIKAENANIKIRSN